MSDQLGDIGAQRGPTTGDPSVARTLDTAAVVTPEAVLLEFRAAGIASRLLAKSIDLIVQFIAFYGVVIVGAVVASVNETTGIVTILVMSFLIVFGYPMTEAFWKGQTLGKRIFGIRVITTEGGPVRFRHAAIRSMVWIVEFMIPPGGLTALTAALLTRRSQRVGDLAAGTVVVRSTKTQSSPVFFSPAYGAEQFSATFDAGRVTPRQYALVREFLVRANDLTPGARARVATRLADAVSASSGRPRPSGLDPERYLVSAVFAYQQRFTPPGLSGVPMTPPPPPHPSTAVLAGPPTGLPPPSRSSRR